MSKMVIMHMMSKVIVVNTGWWYQMAKMMSVRLITPIGFPYIAYISVQAETAPHDVFLHVLRFHPIQNICIQSSLFMLKQDIRVEYDINLNVNMWNNYNDHIVVIRVIITL